MTRVSPAVQAALTVARHALKSRQSGQRIANTIVGALDDRQMLQSPETAVEHERLRQQAAASAASEVILQEQIDGQAREIDRLRTRVAELEQQAAKVTEFVAARAEYITAIRNCHPDNGHDYHRWQGHAEARRQLAQTLGLPVAWPEGGEG